MGRKLTKEELLERFHRRWGDRYDYSKVEYINKRTPIIIGCRKHGDFKMLPLGHADGSGCQKCGNESQAKKMSKPKHDKDWLIKTLESLDDADKFDYSLIREESFVYKGVKMKLPVICRECGTQFPQIASSRLKGAGCNTCRLKNFGQTNKGKAIPISKRKKVAGVGIIDEEGVFFDDKIYRIWREMINRCYGDTHEKRPTYKGCKVCDAWLLFSNYKRWYEEHCVEGFDVDKDLFSGKLYSPDTCCFLPPEINTAISSTKNIERDLPVGVHVISGCVTASAAGKYLGTFKTVEEAQEAYIDEKKKSITFLAEKWKDKLEPRVYEALKNLDIVKHFKL